MMRKVLILIFLMCLGHTTLLAQDFPLTFSVGEWNVGSVPRGSLRNLVIQVTNPTDAAIGIYQFNPMNAAVSARARKTVLQPGETTDIHLQFHAQVPIGNFESAITVTLIGDKRSADIRVKAQVVSAPPTGVGQLKPDTAGIPVLKADPVKKP